MIMNDEDSSKKKLDFLEQMMIRNYKIRYSNMAGQEIPSKKMGVYSWESHQEARISPLQV